MKALWLTLRQTAQLARSQRKLWIPFLVVAFVELLFIGVIWLAPHPPFSKLLAPPIRYFFGERVLHYPAHPWFLYHAMKHTHLVASVLFGAFFTGIACAMVRQIHGGIPLSLRTALISKQVRYGAVTLLWLITWGLAKGMTEGLDRFAPKDAWVFWLGVGVILILQALLVYAIPAAVFEGSTWWKAVIQSVRETFRYPVTTGLVVIVPSAAVILFAVLAPSARVAQWMMQAAPEIALAFVAARLIVWTVADALITVAIAHLWWIHRAGQPARVRPGISIAPVLTHGRFEESHAVA